MSESLQPATDARLDRLQAWLRATLGHGAWRLTPASSDASFRRYFRAHLETADAAGRRTLIIMDAPPDKEDCRPFVKVAALFAERFVDNKPRTWTPVEELSDRELEVFRLLGQGLDTRTVANRLQISIKTVQAYCARIKDKLSLANATELLREAIRWNESNAA